MPGLDIGHLKRYVIAPALQAVDLLSASAVNLLAGTALCESGGVWLVQNPRGPALGLYQMEQATERDCWDNFLFFQPALALRVKTLLLIGNTTQQLVGNLAYATAMCRIKYLRAPEPQPAADDPVAMCALWKLRYNTAGGAGSTDPAHVALFRQAIAA